MLLIQQTALVSTAKVKIQLALYLSTESSVDREWIKGLNHTTLTDTNVEGQDEENVRTNSD